MTFVQSFHSFSINVSHADRQFSERLRFKIPRHPFEPSQYLIARVLAYIDSYAEGLQFSPGYFEPKDPALWKHSITGEPEILIEVGALDADRASRSVRRHSGAQHRVYFYEEAQITHFCHGMRGSKTNWIAPIQFTMIDPAFLDQLAETIPSSSQWEITIVDFHIYLVANDVSYEGDFTTLDMWKRYQDSLTHHQEK